MIILTNALKCVCIITPTRYMYICEIYSIVCRYIYTVPFNILRMFWNLLRRVFKSNIFLILLLSNLTIYRNFFFSGNEFGLWCILFSVLIFLLGWILGETRVEMVLFSLIYRYHVLFAGTYVLVVTIYVLTWRTKSSHSFFFLINPLGYTMCNHEFLVALHHFDEYFYFFLLIHVNVLVYLSLW